MDELSEFKCAIKKYMLQLAKENEVIAFEQDGIKPKANVSITDLDPHTHYDNLNYVVKQVIDEEFG